MAWSQDELKARIGGLADLLKWWAEPGPIGARRGVVVVLRDEMWAQFWRDSGKPVFGVAAEPDTGVEVWPGELFHMEIGFLAHGPDETARRGVRDRILKQLGAMSAYDYAVQQIRAAAEDKRELLDLSGQGLDELPAEIGMLGELLALDLSNNRLRWLPAEIGGLAKLDELVASDNRLAELPGEIGLLTELRMLVMDRNRLVRLPAGIGRLARLAHLQMRENALRELPAEIGGLAGLRRLWLGNNQLEVLPVELSRLDRLKDWEPDGKHLPPRFPWAMEFYGNPLREPPMEVVREGAEAVRGYLRGKVGM